MTGLRPLTDTDATVPDVFLHGVAHQITEALTYVRLKHLAAWERLRPQPRYAITLHTWDSWDRLGDRLGARLGTHVWHPTHWSEHYATLADLPATTPSAVPTPHQTARAARPVVRTRRQAVRAQERAGQPLLALLGGDV